MNTNWLLWTLDSAEKMNSLEKFVNFICPKTEKSLLSFVLLKLNPVDRLPLLRQIKSQ